MTIMTETILALQPPDTRINLRPVRLMDISTLHKNCWPERSPDSIYRFINRMRQLAQNNRGIGVVVTTEADEAIGYGQFVRWPRCGEISDLIIAPGYRRQGLGTALIQYLVNAAQAMPVDCVDIGAAVSNPGAVNLYRRLGFRDSYKQMMNTGHGDEEVLYLRLKFRRPD